MATYEPGDYVKVEFADKTGLGEWMWVRVHRSDDSRKLIFGTLDNEPLNDYGQTLKFGAELAISYAQVREHRKGSDFPQVGR